MVIVLIGYMCCGKSTLGKSIAKILDYKFIDTDKEIEKQEGTPIEEIFASKGEAFFRAAEHNYLLSLKGIENSVIATGGGMPCFADNLSLLKALGHTVYIQLPAKSILDRAKNAKQPRPLLLNKTDEELTQFISDTLHTREAFYCNAHLTVSGIDLQPKELLKRIHDHSGLLQEEPAGSDTL